MTDERILEIIERQDKYYILGFIKGIKANNELLQKENKQLKDNWNKLKDILNIKLARLENEQDYCNYYVEGLEGSINANNKSFGGVLLETTKNGIIQVCEELLYRMQELEKGEE